MMLNKKHTIQLREPIFRNWAFGLGKLKGWTKTHWAWSLYIGPFIIVKWKKAAWENTKILE